LSETYQTHNLTIGTSKPLPARFQLSAILKLASGAPIRVQAFGVLITVGGSRNQEVLPIINDFRTSRGLMPITMDELARLDAYYTLDARLGPAPLTRARRSGREVLLLAGA
jgi:hypothetical protein